MKRVIQVALAVAFLSVSLLAQSGAGSKYDDSAALQKRRQEAALCSKHWKEAKMHLKHKRFLEAEQCARMADSIYSFSPAKKIVLEALIGQERWWEAYDYAKVFLSDEPGMLSKKGYLFLKSGSLDSSWELWNENGTHLYRRCFGYTEGLLSLPRNKKELEIAWLVLISQEPTESEHKAIYLRKLLAIDAKHIVGNYWLGHDLWERAEYKEAKKHFEVVLPLVEKELAEKVQLAIDIINYEIKKAG